MRMTVGKLAGLVVVWATAVGWVLGSAETGMVAGAGLQRGAGPGGGQAAGRGRGQATPGPGVIVGRVVDADTGAAVAEAEVTLAARADVATAPSANLLTGADGRFVAREVPVGNIQVTVTAPGYLRGSHGQSRPAGPSRPIQVTDKNSVIEATIRLWKSAVVSGMVTDEANEPAIDITVRALRQSFANGRPLYAAVGRGRTDDRGIYRIAGLAPGDYIVAVPQRLATVPTATMNSMIEGVMDAQGLPPGAMDLAASGMLASGGTGVQVGEHMVNSVSGASPVLGGDGRMAAYLTQYFPAAGTPEMATVLMLGSGETRAGIDIRMPLASSVTIRGAVIGPEGPMANVPVRLVAAATTDDQGTLSEVAGATTAADGSFAMYGVPVGAYVAKVLRIPRQPLPAALASNPQLQALLGGRGGGPASASDSLTLFAEVPVSAERDVADVVITLSAGATVAGRLEFVGGAAPVTLTGMNVTMTSVDGGTARVGNPFSAARVDADGQFKTAGYPPGRYVMAAAGRAPGWFLKSMMVNGVNALERPFQLEAQDIGNVVVTFGDRQTTVSGTVVSSIGAPTEGSVVVFPAAYKEWITQGMVPRLMRNISTQPDGNFSIAGLLARDYLIVALADEDVPDVQNPSVFDALARAATAVTLTDGDTRNVSLKLKAVVR